MVGLSDKDALPLDGFLILFRSGSSPIAARMARERIAAAHQVTAQGMVKNEPGVERAAIFLSIVAGFQMMGQMIQLPVLADAKTAVLLELLTHVFEPIIGSTEQQQ